jgi:hypothetical protein
VRPIVLLLAAVAIVACGDDSGLSVGEYREKANELCDQANREARRLDPPISPQGFADFLERGLELSRKYEARFKDLDPPDEVKDLHEEALRLNDEFEKRYEAMVERVRQADDPIAEFQRSLQRLLPAIQRGDSMNRRLKLNKCLQSPGLRGTSQGPS